MTSRTGAMPGRFTQGSIMRHVIEMTATGAIGLIAIFLVDFLSLFYISMLDDDRLTAGVGYATTLLFVAISVNIGMMIAASALVARYIGARDRASAKRYATSSLAIAFVAGGVVSALVLAVMPWLLEKLGARGIAYDVALRFLWIAAPANCLMAMGMVLTGLLRAVGDPRRAMQITLYGGVVTAFLDPLFIFAFKMGTDGAAVATVISRLVYLAVGFHGLHKVHGLLERPSLAAIRMDFPAFSGIAGPAILTNLATPVANLFVMRILAQFGEAAIAAVTIMDRLIPLTFGVLFALTGAVGPILGQNLGAGLFDRLRMTMRDSLIVSTLYCLVAWLVLVFLRNQIAAIFGVEGDTARYVAFFCVVAGLAWGFNGLLFVANAAFNNLGYPFYSTAFNWGRATIGTMPFAYYGAQFGGVEGAFYAMVIGSMIFGFGGVFTAFRAISNIEKAATA